MGNININTLPELTGSEKQISWANDLRARAVRYLDEMLCRETATGWIVNSEYYHIAVGIVRTMADCPAYGAEMDAIQRDLEDRVKAHAAQIEAKKEAGEIDFKAGNRMTRCYRYQETSADYMRIAQKVLQRENSARFWIDKFASLPKPEDLERRFGKIDDWKDKER